MTGKKILLDLKRFKTLRTFVFITILTPILISFLTGCSAPASTTLAPTTSTAAMTNNTGPATSTSAPTTAAVAAKPEGEITAAIPDLGNENYLPWLTSVPSSPLCMIVYDMLIYYDYVNFKFIPGLAESWENSPDAMTLTYHLRKGVQWQDGWGEVTAEDIKYNFEKHASPQSFGKTEATRTIKSMEIPDPYTLTVNFKTPQPTFFSKLSWGDGAICQGIVCKKYVETVGEDVAAEKPIGSGPYKLIETQTGVYHKFEAQDTNWRVVPEFKYLTVRAVPEIGTKVAMLKTGELDLANVPGEQLPDLKSAGLATEANPVGGLILNVSWGGMLVPEDKRYNPDVHNKDPWVDPKVRHAMTIAIDRDAINKSIFNSTAVPRSVPIPCPGIEKYQYPYDPVLAKQLLKEAGYPNGFTFNMMSYTYPGVNESPRVVEALVGYWQQIGLDPKITVIEYGRYHSQRMAGKWAGTLGLMVLPVSADFIDKTAFHYPPNCAAPHFMDEGSVALWKEGNSKLTTAERQVYVDKLNQYFFDNYGPIALEQLSACYAWNPKKLSEFPTSMLSSPLYFEYLRHAQPLNTFRLFTPYPGR